MGALLATARAGVWVLCWARSVRYRWGSRALWIGKFKAACLFQGAAHSQQRNQRRGRLHCELCQASSCRMTVVPVQDTLVSVNAGVGRLNEAAWSVGAPHGAAHQRVNQGARVARGRAYGWRVWEGFSFCTRVDTGLPQPWNGGEPGLPSPVRGSVAFNAGV